jgi:hypothetical protein
MHRIELVRNGELFLFCLQRVLSLAGCVRYLFVIEQTPSDEKVSGLVQYATQKYGLLLAQVTLAISGCALRNPTLFRSYKFQFC